MFSYQFICFGLLHQLYLSFFNFLCEWCDSRLLWDLLSQWVLS